MLRRDNAAREKPLSEHTPAVTQATFDEDVLAVSATQPVLVDFWAAWCGPCKMLAPILERIAADYAGRARIVKVDTDREQALAARYGIRSLPTLKLFRDGQPVDDLIGVQPESIVRALIDEYLEKPSDAERAAAHDLLMAGKPDEAVARLEQVCATEPDNLPARIELIEALAHAGRADEAGRLLRSLPMQALDAPRLKAIEAKVHFAETIAGAPDLPSLAARVAAAPNDLNALHQLAVRELLTGHAEPGLEALLTLLQRDPRYGDGLARRSLVHAFALLEGQDELLHRYRRRVASLMH
jgi:putative thioredoxin